MDSLQDDEILSVADNFWRVIVVYNLKLGMVKTRFSLLHSVLFCKLVRFSMLNLVISQLI